MNLTPYFKSIIDQDRAAVVICSLDHKIIYMNIFYQILIMIILVLMKILLK